ncbi:hypothetical protein H9P43_001434 [Blastocladiella emersonii ATCC 22665]|nr:hypothetical protein H9P43_001434 [Blastocladiella emersonii ATCC 22665]
MQPWSTVPAVPKYLGLAGLLPFLATTLGAYTCVPTDILGYQLLQATYGASILSFMGAIHWGSAMAGTGSPATANKRYLISVVPSLAGFASLNMPPDLALPLQLTGFGLLLAQDVHAWRYRELPLWYPTLRVLLTSVVVGTLGATWYANKRPLEVVADIKEGKRVRERE